MLWPIILVGYQECLLGIVSRTLEGALPVQL
jgi:hypothetical protein